MRRRILTGRWAEWVGWLLLLTLTGWWLAGGIARAERAQELDLAAYRGKVVYLDFWASWCVPCRKSFPWMNTVQQKYGGRGLVVIGVNLDREHAQAAKFLQQVSADFKVIYDPKGRLAQAYGLKGMPSSYLIDREGQVRGQHIGFVPAEREHYEARIAELLK